MLTSLSDQIWVTKRHTLTSELRVQEKSKGVELIKYLNILKTEPYGGVEQDDFLNGALQVDTLLSPKELLSELQRIELEAHRERKVRWGPRTLDLDIIMYDDCIVEEDNLTIPHIEMHKRDFVLAPLAQIAPHLRHPALSKTVMQLLEELKG